MGQNFNGEPCPEVLVPDTIIYKYRIPAYWYFTGSDGRLKRKAKANIKNELILKSFAPPRDPIETLLPCTSVSTRSIRRQPRAQMSHLRRRRRWCATSTRLG